MYENLVPIGNTGFYHTPTEPVDPRDCDRWPDSPFCTSVSVDPLNAGIQTGIDAISGEGIGYETFDPISGLGIDEYSAINDLASRGATFSPWNLANLEPSISINNCEQCITISPTLFYISLPPYTICYRFRDGSCSVPELPQPYEPPNAAEGDYPEFSPPGPVGYCPAGARLVVYATYKFFAPLPPGTTAPDDPSLTNRPYHYRPGLPFDCYNDERGSYYTNSRYNIYQGEANDQGTGQHCPIPRHYSRNLAEIRDRLMWDFRISRAPDERQNRPDGQPPIVNPGGWQFNSYTFNFPGVGTYSIGVTSQILQDGEAPPNRVINGVRSFHWKKVIDLCGSLPPPQPHQDPMSCCNTAEIEELLRLVALRIGVTQYPASVPENLLTNLPQRQIRLQSLTELFGWYVKQFDALIGEFPINLKIQDIDPLTEGDQEQEIKLMNVAETLVELYALAAKTSINSDLHTNFLTRLAAEVISTKNATVVTQDYARANAQFLGYKGNPKKRKIPYSFDPESLDSLEKLLRNSEKFVVGWQEDDPESVVNYLQKIVFSAGIIKAVFFRGGSQASQLIGELRNLIDPNSDVQQGRDEGWEAFIDAINNPESPFNANSPTLPRVTDPNLNDATNNNSQRPTEP